MLRRMYWVVALLLLLSLPALACGVFGGDDAEEATAVPEAAPAAVEETEPEPAEAASTVEEPTAVPAAEVEETPAEEEAPPLPESALSVFDSEGLPFNSYRMTMLIEVSGTTDEGQEVTQRIDSNMAFSKDPQAMDITMSFTGIDEELGNGSIQMVQIDDIAYMVMPEMGCITTSGEEIMTDNPFTEMANPDEFLDGLNDPKYEGEETINGILTRHYSFDQFSFMGTSGEDIEFAEGHVYIAKDGNYMVRMVMDATGNIDMLDETTNSDGTFHMEMELVDIDQPVNVVIPESCSSEAMGSEYPMLDDAAEVTSFAGMLNYRTAASLEDALAFYDEALAAEGWIKDEDGSFVGGGTAMVSYARDSEEIMLSITSTEDDSGNNYVTIFGEMGE